jgi:hypothetical protein
VDRDTNLQGVDLIRRAIAGPHAEAYLSADQLHRELRRLEARLAGVQARGGAYRHVQMSRDVRALLVRLEAGASLSSAVH